MHKISGSIWKHVWGSDGEEYSRQVIKSYICKHGNIILERRRGNEGGGGTLSVATVATIHKAGSNQSNLGRLSSFGRLVHMIHRNYNGKIFLLL